MTPEEKAYEEALRRIREAEETGAVELDLSGVKEGETGAEEPTGLETLTRLPPELAGLTSLQTLNLTGCEQLSGNLSQLASLTSLQSLNLTWCRQLSETIVWRFECETDYFRDLLGCQKPRHSHR
jgi:hypothetical protein